MPAEGRYHRNELVIGNFVHKSIKSYFLRYSSVAPVHGPSIFMNCRISRSLVLFCAKVSGKSCGESGPPVVGTLRWAFARLAASTACFDWGKAVTPHV